MTSASPVSEPPCWPIAATATHGFAPTSNAQGVERETAETAVGAFEPEPERALREAVKAGGGLRAIRSLGRRGFSEDALEAVAAALVADEAPEGVG